MKLFHFQLCKRGPARCAAAIAASVMALWGRGPCAAGEVGAPPLMAAGVEGESSGTLLMSADLTPNALTVATGDAMTSGSAIDSRADAVLQSLQRRYENVRSVYGEFEQLSRSDIFLEEAKAEGRFWHVKPGKFRCEISPPYDERTVIAEDVVYYAVAQIKQVEKHVFESEQAKQEFLDRFLIGFGLTSEEILNSYKVEYLEADSRDGFDALRFIPRFEDESGLDAVTMWVGREIAAPEKMLIDYGESQTTVFIKKLEFNPEIEDKRFEADFPKDWTIVERF